MITATLQKGKDDPRHSNVLLAVEAGRRCLHSSRESLSCLYNNNWFPASRVCNYLAAVYGISSMMKLLCREEGIDLRGPPAGLPAESGPEQDHPSASAHILTQAAPRNVHAQPANAVGLLCPQRDAINDVIIGHYTSEIHLLCSVYCKSFLEILAYAAKLCASI
ncbi:hypothetical protein ABBQ38_014841 [Trebouxia sp. C0009 RCD-2024]